MLNGIYSTASAMNANVEAHQRVAHNLAHINVPGFRRQLSIMETSQGQDDQTAGADARSLNGIQIGQDQTDFSTGPIKGTGRPLDVAINGDGFFEIEGPNGPLYTRNGTFHRSESGELVNATGMKIAGDGGPISIPPDAANSEINIAQDGGVSVAGNVVGKLNIVNFDDQSLLSRAGTTLFANDRNALEVPGKATVQQGYLESSNTSSVHELVQMMIGSRHLEASQQALKTISDAIQQHTQDR